MSAAIYLQLQNYKKKRSIDLYRLLHYANTADTYLNLLSRYGYEFNAKGNSYQSVDSQGLRLYKNRDGQWLTHNFSLKTDVPSGGIFQLAEHFLNVRTKGNYEDFKRVCELIAACSGQELKSLESDNNTPFPKPKKRPKIIEKDFVPNYGYEPKQSYLPRPTPWNSEVGEAVVAYFKRWGIELSTLKKYSVEALGCLKSTNGERIIYKFNKQDFAFIYVPDGIGGNIKYKRPNSPIKGKKEGYIQSSGNYVFGLNQLPEDCSDKTLIIAAGEKDCLVLNQHLNKSGIYSICFYNETANFNYRFINSLKAKFNSSVFTLYDNDKAGIEGMLKATRRNNISSIKLGKYVNNPFKFLNHGFKEIEFKINQKKKGRILVNTVLNDASDIVDKLGANELRKIIYTQIGRILERKKKVIPQNGYLNEMLKGINTENGKLSFFTGLGKTRYILNIFGKKLILVPNSMLADSIEKDEDNQHLDIFRYRSTKEQQARLKAITYFEDLPDVIITTYKAFQCTLAGILRPFAHSLHLIIDEWHELILSSTEGFMLSENRYIINQIKSRSYKSIRLLSATPVFNTIKELQGFKEFTTDAKPSKKDLYLYDCKNTLKTAAELITELSGPKNQVIALMDNKSEEGRLGTLKKLIGDDNVKAFNSETKNDELHKQIAETGLFPDWLKAAIFTSVMKAGNSLKGVKHFHIIIVGNYHPANTIQIVGRPRKGLSVTVHIVRSSKRNTTEEKYFDFHQRAFDTRLQAEALVNELNTKDVTNIQIDREKRVIESINRFPIDYDEHTGKYYVCEIMLSQIVNDEFKVVTGRNDELLIKELAKANIIHKETRKDFVEINKQERSEINAGKEVAKSKKEQDRSDFLDKIKEQHFPSKFCDAISKQANAKPIEKEVAQQYLRLSEEIQTSKKVTDISTGRVINENPVLRILGSTGSKNKYKELLRQIDAFRLKDDVDYMASGRKLGIIINEIYQTFSTKDYTSENIEKMLVGIFSKHNGFKAVKFESDTHKKATRIIKIFFDADAVRHIKKRDDRGYKLSTPAIWQELKPSIQKKSQKFRENALKSLMI